MDLAFPAQFLFLVIFGDDRMPGLSHTRPNKTLQDSDDFLKRKWFYPKQVTFMRNFSFPTFPCYVFKKHPTTKNVSVEAVFSSISSHSSSPAQAGGSLSATDRIPLWIRRTWRATVHPKAPDEGRRRMDGWMDGWMDEVWQGFFPT